MDYEDFLAFLCAVAVVIVYVGLVLVFMLPDKKKCDKCAHRTKKGCRIVNWEKIEDLNIDGRCGFYKEKGE